MMKLILPNWHGLDVLSKHSLKQYVKKAPCSIPHCIEAFTIEMKKALEWRTGEPPESKIRDTEFKIKGHWAQHHRSEIQVLDHSSKAT